MKAILYIGAILMVGASVYGFIDYKKSSHDKNFRRLYDNKEQVVAPKQETDHNLVKEEPAKVSEEPRTDRSSASPVAETKKEPTINSTDKKSAKAKRKIALKKYSRAALDEKYLKEETKVKVEPKNKEVKVEKKQQ